MVRAYNPIAGKCMYRLSSVVFKALRPEIMSAVRPMMNAAAIYPIIYPPVGPAKTPIPPLNPENTGIPTAPSNTYTAILIVPYFLPSIPPVRNTASVPRLIGTGVNPRGIVIKEQMAVIAAKIPHKIIIAVPE